MSFKSRIFVLLLIPFSVAGQELKNDRFTDSLEIEAAEANSVILKAKAFFTLSEYWSLKDTGRAVSYVRQAENLALDKYQRTISTFYLANAYKRFAPEKAALLFKKADTLLAAYSTKGAFKYRSQCWLEMAGLARLKVQSKQAVDNILTKALPFAEKSGDSLLVARSYMALAIPFHNNGDQPKALYYFGKANDLFLALKDQSVSAGNSFSYTARAFIQMNDLENAKKALVIARSILNKNEPGSVHVFYYVQEGAVNRELKNWSQAKANLDTALGIAAKTAVLKDKAMAMDGYMSLYKDQKNYPALKQILMLFYTQGFNLMAPHDQVRLLRDLATTEAALGNKNTAYDWMLRYTVLNDSFKNANINTQITELETRYNYLEKEKELLQVANKSRTQRLVLLTVAALFIVSLLLFWYISKQRKLRAEQQMKQLKQQQELEVTRALIAGEDQERKRLAQDLHDGLGGLLANVKLNLSRVKPVDEDAMKDVTARLDNAVKELRRIARNMMPESLMQFGLSTAIRDLGAALSAENFRVELVLLNLEEDRIDSREQMIIYRIIQELLTNVIKHANATKVLVQCSIEYPVFCITVEDNGRGFNIEELKTRARRGIGLQNIQNRVDFLQGKMDISSEPGMGTTTNIELLCGTLK